MKSTGIVRRIDELGRIVIPKEIRKTLKLKTGEEMEIYTNENNEIIFKKYSSLTNLSILANDIVDIITKSITCTAIVTDKDQVIAVKGEDKDDFKNKLLTDEAKELIEKKNYTSYNGGNTVELVDTADAKYQAQLIMPVISKNSVIGSIIIVSSERNFEVSDLSYLKLTTAILNSIC